MPSDSLTPFLELDEEFCKNLCVLDGTDGPSSSSLQRSQRVLGFQRRHSLCPVTLPNSKFNSSSEVMESACWGLSQASNQQWNRALQRSSLSHIPFRVDRSVSMIEGNISNVGGKEDKVPTASPSVLLPPPGLCLSNTSLASTASSSSSRPPVLPPPHISSRYKTELCRTFEESGTCKYGAKCQFAHGLDELRGLSRHPKYKTEPCRTFHTIGFCPYGARCHFIHNADEIQMAGSAAAPQRPKVRPPLLRHSLSFAGFSSTAHIFQPVEESQPSSLLFSRASSVSPPPSSGSPELLSPLFPEPRPLKHCPYPFSGISDLAGDSGDAALRLYTTTESKCPTSSFTSKNQNLPVHLPPQLPASLNSFSSFQRCSSAESLSEEGYTSSCSLSSSSSGTESPSFEGRRLPIFSRLSISDE
ncbi:PREDICTED: zinc finger protein 36, C3H1 type-like 1 [Cyprinodon variegatus]|uniref:mRNA decay activator protein ZFP36 n=1 Tax=Cyprinodon variegatus TaxID=28743 RepID=A0A3Q2DY55_CYPVA|nr:PREDICTED: zinc finger protein 36, C3H1 type-like 1 [Cyprinodon variegatus]